jgi:hypothetical protein
MVMMMTTVMMTKIMIQIQIQIQIQILIQIQGQVEVQGQVKVQGEVQVQIQIQIQAIGFQMSLGVEGEVVVEEFGTSDRRETTPELVSSILEQRSISDQMFQELFLQTLASSAQSC